MNAAGPSAVLLLSAFGVACVPHAIEEDAAPLLRCAEDSVAAACAALRSADEARMIVTTTEPLTLGTYRALEGIADVRGFSATPQFAATVSLAGLRALLAREEVLSIAPDSEMAPLRSGQAGDKPAQPLPDRSKRPGALPGDGGRRLHQ